MQSGNLLLSIYLILPAALGTGVYTQPLTEMSTRDKKNVSAEQSTADV
jgi:hypothetical protein